jgi:ethanolamine transporter EutH
MYVIAVLLFLLPTVDFALSIPAAEFSSVQWRFATVGVLSGYTLLPIAGLGLGFVIASVRKHLTVQRILVLMCLTIALILIVMTMSFVLDGLQVRASVPEEGLAAFTSAFTRALLKLALSAVALAYMGWRARRMIPASVRRRSPRTVHVVSK